jgi:replicative DNA helicase
MNIDEDVSVREFTSGMNNPEALPPINPAAGVDFLRPAGRGEVPF